MLQRIGVAQALIHRPELVILDEPMSGLDPDGRLEVREIIRETADEGTAVFFSSHLLHDAELLCKNLVVLKDGKVHYQGEVEELLGKVDLGSTISFLKNGKPELLSAVASDALNGEIDRLRREGCEILEVKRDRMSLEEAFVKVAFEERPK